MSNTPTESLTRLDLLACLDVVHRYATASLAPQCERHEQPMTAPDVRLAVLALQELGVLNPEQTPAIGCWDDAAGPLSREWSWRALRELAQVNAGVAVQVHLQALAWQLDRRAGQLPRPHGLLVCNGFMGLGRDAVVADLVGEVLSADQISWLADNWAWPSVERPRYLYGLPDWEWVWLPVWSQAQGWAWFQMSRAMCEAQALPHAHGLDELTLFALSVKPEYRDAAPLAGAAIRGDAARQAWVAVQAMHAVGLLAIGVGAVTAAWRRARDFAQLRHQGGKTIIGHAAVQALLAEASGAACDGERALRALAGASWPDLRQRWSERLRHQSALCAGASAALQVFGGMGYMQDNGMEKSLRDLNVLRLMGGAPAELRYALAYWDTVQPQLQEVGP